MRFFEDLQPGELLSGDGHVVDADEAADFARRYDPQYRPPAGTAYIHRGPQISPWQAAALSWKLLSEVAAGASIQEATFTKPAEVQWLRREGERLQAGWRPGPDGRLVVPPGWHMVRDVPLLPPPRG